MFSRLSSMVQRNFARRPVLTNTLFYTTFYTAAEATQQTFNKYLAAEKVDYDPAAGLRVVAVGGMLYAPVLYHWYKYLDGKFQGKSLKVVATKVGLDQFLMTPILLAIFFTLLGILEGKEDIFEDLRHKYWTAFMFNQMFWIPCQSANFLLVPPQFRVVFVATFAFLWINILVFIKRKKPNTQI